MNIHLVLFKREQWHMATDERSWTVDIKKKKTKNVSVVLIFENPVELKNLKKIESIKVLTCTYEQGEADFVLLVARVRSLLLQP